MMISEVRIKNWRNFKTASFNLYERSFIVGPNASGKSNLIDVFRFLRDIVKTGGGLQEAVSDRGGVSKIRCLSARTQPDIEIEISLLDQELEKVKWNYNLGFTQTGGGFLKSRAKLRYEKIKDVFNDKIVLARPDKNDKEDEKLLEYTHLEQPTTNKEFREIADFLSGIDYLHIIPQLLRDSSSFVNVSNNEDYFGRTFIERINKANTQTRNSYLRRIEKALKSAVPQFQELSLVKDDRGIPHLQATYQHWRAKGAKQQEDQFSDGTLRLIGLFWALLDGTKPILLEEPEQSLHTGIISRLPEIISRLQRKKKGKRQVLMTTHSFDLLNNEGIAGREVLLLEPSEEGTEVKNASDIKEIKVLLESGLNVGEIVLDYTAPREFHQLKLFEL